MEYKIKISQTFLPYLLVLIVIVGVVVYLDRLSGTYSSEAVVITVTDQGQSEQIALWQPELDETLSVPEKIRSNADFQAALEAYKQGDWQHARQYWQQVAEANPEASQVWELLGRAYIKSERYRHALEAFQKSLSLDSTYQPALVNIGNAYAGLQQYQQAERAYRRAATLTPNRPFPYLNLGMVLSQQEKWAEAISELEKARMLSEGKVKAKSSYYKGFAHLQFQDTLTALQHFKQARELRPSYVRPEIQEIFLTSASLEKKKEALLKLANEKSEEAKALVFHNIARLYQQHNNPEIAGEFLLEALRTHPEDIEIKTSLGKHYLQQNQLTQAEMLFKRMVNMDSLLPQPYYFLAKLEAIKNNKLPAIGLYEKAIAITEGNFREAYLGKGIIEESLNNTESAIQSYQRALATWPEYPEAHYHLGQAYLKNQQPEKAVDAFQKTLAVRPGFAKAWYGMGIAYNQSGKNDSALVSLQKALVYDPELLNARMALGTLHQEEGNYSEAIAHYQQLLKQHPTFSPALLSLGEALRKNDQQKAALQTFERLVALKPTAMEPKEKLAYLYAIQNKTKKAVKLYEELVEAIPYDHKLRFNLAIQYEQQAKYRDAIDQLVKALELKPGFERASKKLENIQSRLNQSPPMAFDN